MKKHIIRTLEQARIELGKLANIAALTATHVIITKMGDPYVKIVGLTEAEVNQINIELKEKSRLAIESASED